jgi:hypothetical protein
VAGRPDELHRCPPEIFALENISTLISTSSALESFDQSHIVTTHSWRSAARSQYQCMAEEAISRNDFRAGADKAARTDDPTALHVSLNALGNGDPAALDALRKAGKV